ncbi:MAG: periplasmic heavy metal sensor [Planctomycetes bacterium]|nr:periplasmic heavy metal sensor [Planctomycetota bacterium]
MDSFTKSQYLGWTVLALILLNLLALGMLWTSFLRAPESHRDLPFASRRERPGRSRSSDIMRRELGLSPLQAEQVRSLHQQHFAQINGLQREIHEARQRLSEAIFREKVGGAEIQDLADQVGEKWSLLEIKRFEHFKRIEALCDQQQKDRLKTLIEGVLTTVGPPMGTGPRGPHPELGQHPMGPRGPGPHPDAPNGRPRGPRRRGMPNGSRPENQP